MKNKLIKLILGTSMLIALSSSVATFATEDITTICYTPYATENLHNIDSNTFIIDIFCNKFKSSILQTRTINSKYIYYLHSKVMLSNYNLVAKNILIANNYTIDSPSLFSSVEVLLDVANFGGYEYKSPDNIYWVQAGNEFNFATNVYTRRASGVFPDKTYIDLWTGSQSNIVAIDSNNTILSNSINNDSGLKVIRTTTESPSLSNTNFLVTHVYLTANIHGKSFEGWWKGGYSSSESSWKNSNQTIKVDGLGPTITYSQDSSNWSNNSKTVKISVGDPDSGVKNWEVWTRVNDGEWQRHADNLTSFTFSTDGKHELWVQAFDNVGNSTTKTEIFTIDTIGPAITYSQDSSNWSNGSKTVNISVNDPVSGVKNWEVWTRTDGGEWQRHADNLTSFTFSTDGKHELWVQAFDNVGNSTIKTEIFTVDSVGPTIKYTPSTSNWTTTSKTVEISVTDAVSGVKNWEVWTRVNDGEWQRHADNLTSFTFSTTGKHELWVDAFDNEGNSSTLTQVFTNDASKPVALITDSTYDTYTVTVKNLPSNTAYVRFPTWTPATGQNDILKNRVVPTSKDSFSFTINRADYEFNNTHFVTDVYYELSDGTVHSIGRLEHGFPKIYTEVTSSNSSSYTVSAYNVPSKIPAIQFPTWTVANGQDDIKWYTATNKGNGTWTYTVNRSDHNNEKGIYETHTYAVLNGSKTGTGNNIKYNFEIPINLEAISIVGLSDNGTYMPDNSKKEIYVKPGVGEIIMKFNSSTDEYHKNYRVDSTSYYVYDSDTKELLQNLQMRYLTDDLSAWNKHSFVLNKYGLNPIESWLAREPKYLTCPQTLNQIRVNFQEGDRKYTIVPYAEIYLDDKFSDSNSFYTSTDAKDYSKGITVITDGTAPTLKFLNEKTEWQSVPSYTLKWTASDNGSGLKNIGYQIQGSEWKQFLPSPEDIIITKEGKTAVSIKAIDNVGNTTILNTFVAIDRTAPTISGYGDVGWAKVDLNMNISSSDSLSGVKSMELRKDGSSTVLASGTSNITHTYGEEGITKFIVTSTDKAGNTSSQTFTYRIDKTAPTVEFTESVYPDGTPLLELSVSDALSGVNKWQVRYNKNSTGWVTMLDNVTSIPLNIGDSYVFEVTTYDKAGNSKTYTYHIEGIKPPAVALAEVSGYSYKESDSIYWVRQNASGALQIKTQAYYPSTSGIYPTETQIALATSNYTAGTTSVSSASTSGMVASGNEFSSHFTLNSASEKAIKSVLNSQNTLTATHKLTALSNNKTYKVYVAGKYNNLQSEFKDTGITIKTDGTAPEINGAVDVGWTNQNIDINLSATDLGSGVKSLELYFGDILVTKGTNNLSYSNRIEAIRTFTAVAIDNVGNEKRIDFTHKIDKRAPIINNIPANNSTFEGNKLLEINATDVGDSGMKKITLYKNNVELVSGTDRLSYDVNTSGQHTFKVVAEDNAGNKTEKIFTLIVIKKPSIDNLSVVKYDYKESNSVYWVRPNINGVLQIKTQAYFPYSYGIYPTETQLGLGKLNYTSGTSSLAWATTSGTGSSGSEFATNFTLSNGSNKATTSSSNGKNILTFTHTLTPKLDNADYRLYSSGKYNSEQADFVNSSILIKTDGTAPTIKETSAIPTGWTNKDVTITFTSSDSRSGVKNNQIKYTGTNTAPTEVTLNNANTITFTNTDYYSVALLSTDNVGNVSKKTGSFGIDKIKPVIGTTPSNGTEYLDMTTLNIKSTDDGGSLMKSLTLYRNGVKVAEGVDSVSYFENVNGTHTFKVVAEDNAGNITEKEFTITILEDSINLITIPNNPQNLIRLEWNHQNLLNKSYTVYQKREDESVFSVVPGTGDTFTNRVLDNTYASDVTPPDMPNVSFVEETDTNVKYTILPTKDNGTTYEFYVVSKDNYGKLTQSNTATDTVKTEVKGYTYVVDGNTNTIPDKTVDVTVAVSEIVAPIQDNFDHYLHIAAIDNAGNMGPVNHIKIWEAVEDNWFNQEIANQVGKDYSEIRISDYRSIEFITLRNKGIVGEIPKDIKKTINLLELDLYKNSIDDISNLTGLTKLEYLQLGNNQISDISTLTGLTELTDLNIYNNNVSDISIVAQMPNLERLYIHKNNITDISAVENLNNLEELYFELNYIDLTNPTTIRIIEKFENKGCYVVSAPQNIVRANENDIVELNIGDEFIPKTILGLSENSIDIIGEYSILRASEVNYISSDKNIVDVQNNKLVALSEGDATITVVHKQFRSIATVSFTVKVVDTNKDIIENADNNTEEIETSEDVSIEDNCNISNNSLVEADATIEEVTSSVMESESIIKNEPNKEKDEQTITNEPNSNDDSDIEIIALE